jgi:hypothetical protein
MSALPVARYLDELAPGGRASGAKNPFDKASADSGVTSATSSETAYARGLEEGRAEARAECEARLEEQVLLFENRLCAERQNWVADESERLRDLIASGFVSLEANLAASVARSLKPLLVAEVHRRAVSEFHEALDALLAKGDVASLVISGPQDLLDSVRERLGQKVAAATFVPGDCELHVVADETVIETRLEAWTKAIAGEEA